jgi:hypothetical protein
MSFRLLIECSKDISKLKIDFTDGTSVATTSDTQTTQKSLEPLNPQDYGARKDEYLNTEDTNDNHNRSIVEKPVILKKERDVKVANELQNLDI